MLTCSLHCTRALWISFGFRAWAWGKQLSASSAAARTMLESLAREALSANDATSGGVRCPSQHSTKMFKAALPISMACPERKRKDSHTTVCLVQLQSAFPQRKVRSSSFLQELQQSPVAPLSSPVKLRLFLPKRRTGQASSKDTIVRVPLSKLRQRYI